MTSTELIHWGSKQDNATLIRFTRDSNVTGKMDAYQLTALALVLASKLEESDSTIRDCAHGTVVERKPRPDSNEKIPVTRELARRAADWDVP